MSKVYCKKCVFNLGRSADMCHPFSYEKQKWYGGYVRNCKTSYPITCAKVNADNDCPYYECKWWRFLG